MMGSFEASAPGRHYAAAPVLDALHDDCLVRPVEPDLVGQVWRAELAIALALLPVADCAIVGEDLLAKREIGAGLDGKIGKGPGKVGHRRNFVGLQNIVSAESRHIAARPLSSPARAP